MNEVRTVLTRVCECEYVSDPEVVVRSDLRVSPELIVTSQIICLGAGGQRARRPVTYKMSIHSGACSAAFFSFLRMRTLEIFYCWCC